MEGSAKPCRYRTESGLTIALLQPQFGALLEAADLCKPIPVETAHDIRQAVLDHGVVFFRNQPISYENHLALALLFGEPFTEGIFADRPEILPLKSNPDAPNPAGGHWHSDGTYLHVAPSVSILHVPVAAPLGGDTCFASATAAFRGLPENVKQRIAPLRARASMTHIHKVQALAGFAHALAKSSHDEIGVQGLREIPEWSEHPVVRVHPETRQPLLYVNEVHTIDIVGLDEDESAELLGYLCAQFRRPEYQLRWHWADDGVAIWDNRQVQHYAVRNEAGPRYAERIMVKGTPSIGFTEKPQPAEAGV
jgi:taurine dioxygenase